MSAEENLGPQWFHGSSSTHDYQPGHVIDPSQPHEQAGNESSSSAAYFTSDRAKASFYADRAATKFGGEPTVYTVEPQGEHRHDMMTKRSPENRVTNSPLTVTGRADYYNWGNTHSQI